MTMRSICLAAAALAFALNAAAQDAPVPLRIELPASAPLAVAAAASAPAPAPLPAGRGSITFIGTATVLLRFGGFTLLTDPNFLHKGDHVHLGYGLTSERRTEPAMAMSQLPPIDAVLLSHYHGDHFDPLVEAQLNKAVPIVTTPHAAQQLKERGFTAAQALQTWQPLELSKGGERLRITAMPGRHGPPVVAAALPPVMGSLVEFLGAQGEPAYRLYISGDTLVYRDLEDIPKRFPQIDLALLHLGGTRVLGILVTMDAEQGVRAMQLIKPELTVPIHNDDYTVFKSSLDDFKRAVKAAGLEGRVRYLDPGAAYEFSAKPAR